MVDGTSAPTFERIDTAMQARRSCSSSSSSSSSLILHDDQLHQKMNATPTTTTTLESFSLDVKLRTAETLLTKLAFGCSDAQRQAVAEIRLFSKWDANNRACLVRAGSIPRLVALLSSTDPKLQENSVTALLNLSLHPDHRIEIVHSPLGLEAIASVLRSGLTSDSKANAAALLCSLLVEESLRPILASHPALLPALLELLRDGSSKCKANSLKALFHISLFPPNKAILAAVGAVPLLLTLVTFGKAKLTEDSLAVLAQIAACPEGSASLLLYQNAIPIIMSVLETGSLRAQENAAAALLKICENGGDEAIEEIVDCRKCIPAIRGLYYSGSERGRSKAEALMKILNVRIPPSSYSGMDIVRDSSLIVNEVSEGEPVSQTRLLKGRWKQGTLLRRLRHSFTCSFC